MLQGKWMSPQSYGRGIWPGPQSNISSDYQQLLNSSQGDPNLDALGGEFSSALLAALKGQGGISDAAVEGIINQGTEEISESESRAGRQLRDTANAMGFGEGGARIAGQALQGGQYAGMRANLGRDVRLAAEQDRANKQAQAMGMAGSYIGQERNRAAGTTAQAKAMMQSGSTGHLPTWSASMAGDYGGAANNPALSARGSALGLKPGYTRGSTSAPGPPSMGGMIVAGASTKDRYRPVTAGSFLGAQPQQ